jgi:hypothetical protein
MTPEDEEFARIEAEINRRQGDTPPAAQPAPVQEHILTVRAWRDENGDQHAEFRGWHTLPEGQHTFYTTPPAPQPVPVKTYHDGKPWPIAPKPWVGLSRDEVLDIEETTTHPLAFYQAIENKLRERNT